MSQRDTYTKKYEWSINKNKTNIAQQPWRSGNQNSTEIPFHPNLKSHHLENKKVPWRRRETLTHL